MSHLSFEPLVLVCVLVFEHFTCQRLAIESFFRFSGQIWSLKRWLASSYVFHFHDHGFFFKWSLGGYLVHICQSWSCSRNDFAWVNCHGLQRSFKHICLACRHLESVLLRSGVDGRSRTSEAPARTRGHWLERLTELVFVRLWLMMENRLRRSNRIAGVFYQFGLGSVCWVRSDAFYSLSVVLNLRRVYLFHRENLHSVRVRLVPFVSLLLWAALHLVSIYCISFGCHLQVELIYVLYWWLTQVDMGRHLNTC